MAVRAEPSAVLPAPCSTVTEQGRQTSKWFLTQRGFWPILGRWTSLPIVQSACRFGAATMSRFCADMFFLAMHSQSQRCPCLPPKSICCPTPCRDLRSTYRALHHKGSFLSNPVFAMRRKQQKNSKHRKLRIHSLSPFFARSNFFFARPSAFAWQNFGRTISQSIGLKRSAEHKHFLHKLQFSMAPRENY